MSEILGTLFKYLLALLAITAVVAVLYEALSSNKISTAAAQITTMQANINQLYAGTSSGPSSSLDAGTLVSAGEVPEGMTTSGTGDSATISNSWGGQVLIGQDSSTTSDVDITYQKVPQEACNKLAMALLPSMAQITIGSTVVTTSGSTSGSTTTDPVSAVTGACTNASGGNTMIFTFPAS